MRRRFCSAVAALVLAIVAAPGAARADIITPMFFDGFEADSADVMNAVLVNWNVTAGAVDVLTAGNVCGPAAGNYSTCVDLDGTSTLAGTIETKQTFAVNEGTYRLSFDLAGANRPWIGSEINSVVVSFGDYFSETFTMARYDPFQTFTRDIAAAGLGTAKIEFNHAGGDWIGLLLDNVSLAHVVIEEVEVVPTPESGAWELMIAGLGLALFPFARSARRRFAVRS